MYKFKYKRNKRNTILCCYHNTDQMKLISRTVRKDKRGPIYAIESILNHRGEPGGYEYFIKWKGYDSTFNSWEPASNFMDDHYVKEYWKTLSAHY